jgi:hypothetical protein
LKPFRAKVAAMPRPILPSPTTPTVSIFIAIPPV